MNLKTRRVIVVIILFLILAVLGFFMFKLFNMFKTNNNKNELKASYELKNVYEFDVSEPNTSYDVGDLKIIVNSCTVEDSLLKIQLSFENKDSSKHVYNIQSWAFINDQKELLAYNASPLANTNEQEVFNSAYIKEKYDVETKEALIASKINGYTYMIDDYFPDSKLFLTKTYSVKLSEDYTISNPVTIDLLNLKYQVLDDDTFYSVDSENLSLIRFNINFDK